MTLPVYALGFADTYADFFNAIAASMGSKSYGSLIKLAVLLGGTWALVMSSLKRNMGFTLKWLITYVVMMSAILMPKVTLQIIDSTNPGKSRAVANVPLGLGVLASFTSRIGVGLAQLVDDTFHTPNELDYTESGMLMGAELLLASTQFQVVGGDFQKNLRSFTEQCVFYDLLLHKYSLQDLVESTNIWQFVVAEASSARAFIYKGKVTTCQQGSISLSNDWKSALASSSDRYAHLLFPENKNAKAQLLSVMPTAYHYFAGLSEDASTLMQQNMMIQTIQDGLQSWSAHIGSMSGLESAMFAKAQEQKRAAYSNLYRMAVYWTPLLKVTLELVLYGIFIIVVFLAFFPIGWEVVKNYLCAMVWIQCWAPLFAFTNFILNLILAHWAKSATLLSNGTHGLALSTFSGLDQMTLDLGRLAGFLCILVPFLVAGIFKGLMNVFTSISQVVSGAAQSLSFGAASEAVTGNVSLGNTQINNHSANNTNANHFDTNARVSSGLMSYQLDGGSQISVTASGEKILNTQGGISSIPVSVSMAESLRSSFSKMADEAWSAGMREVHSASESYSAGFRQLDEFGSSHAYTEGSGESSSLSTSGSFSSAAREVHQLVDRFARDNQLSHSEASRLLGSAYGDAHITGTFNLKDQMGGKVWNWFSGFNFGVTASGGVKGEMSHSNDWQVSEIDNKAASFAKENNFSQAVDYAVRAAHDSQYRTGSEFTAREATSIASHFEEGNRYAKEAASSFDHSRAYREQESYVKENSSSINLQATQEFVNWMSQQPVPGSNSGRMDAVTLERIMKNEPELKQRYAEQFIQSHQETYKKTFQSTASPSSIHSAYEGNNSSIGGLNAINQAKKSNDQIVKREAEKINADRVNDRVLKSAEALIQESKERSENTVDQSAQSIIEAVKHAEKQGIKRE